MSASSSSQEFGKRLKAEREHLRLSLRQVQELSRGIAEHRKNSEYYIAHSSLADIEKGNLTTNIYKLYSLSVIYGRQYEKLVTFFDVPVGEAEKDHKALVFPQTYLVGAASELGECAILSPLELRERLRSERTNLVSRIFEHWKDVPPALLQQMHGMSATPVMLRSSAESRRSRCALRECAKARQKDLRCFDYPMAHFPRVGNLVRWCSRESGATCYRLLKRQH